MFEIVFTLIIIVIGFILLGIGLIIEEGLSIGIGVSFIIAGITLNILMFKELTENPQIKTSLPETIYESRKGDTLYIQKRTKDSLYLEFKPTITP